MWRRAVALASAYSVGFTRENMKLFQSSSPTGPESSCVNRLQPASPPQPDSQEREGGYKIYFDDLFPVVLTSQPIKLMVIAAPLFLCTISSSPTIRSRSGIPYTLS